jgi:hypothetical protein
MQEHFKDTKRILRNHKSTMQWSKGKQDEKTSKYPQNTTQKAKHSNY